MSVTKYYVGLVPRFVPVVYLHCKRGRTMSIELYMYVRASVLLDGGLCPYNRRAMFELRTFGKMDTRVHIRS